VRNLLFRVLSLGIIIGLSAAQAEAESFGPECSYQVIYGAGNCPGNGAIVCATLFPNCGFPVGTLCEPQSEGYRIICWWGES
jgi:hypothetical protein